MKYHFYVHEIGWDFPLYVGAFEVWIVVKVFKVSSNISSALLDLVVLVRFVLEGFDHNEEKNDEDYSQQY